MTVQESSRQTYLISLGNELKKLIELPEDQRGAKIETFYHRLHKFDQRLTYGTARTADAGLMDLYAAVSAFRQNTPDSIMAQVDILVQNLRARSEGDSRLGGLGLQPHEIVIQAP